MLCDFAVVMIYNNICWVKQVTGSSCATMRARIPELGDLAGTLRHLSRRLSDQPQAECVPYRLNLDSVLVASHHFFIHDILATRMDIFATLIAESPKPRDCSSLWHPAAIRILYPSTHLRPVSQTRTAG